MPEGGAGIQGFLGKDTAGLPNWAWLLVVAGGIAAAYFVPKFLGGQSSSSTSSTDQSAQAQAQGQGGPTGIGLAVDPTTGLPYAVEGLSPSGGLAGGGGGVDLSGITTALNSILANLNKTTPPTPTPVTGKGSGGCPKGSVMCNGKCQPAGLLCRDTAPKPITQPQETRMNAAFDRRIDTRVTVPSWPHTSQSLSDVARMHGVSEKRLQQLNPQIVEPHNLQPGQKVRVA